MFPFWFLFLNFSSTLVTIKANVPNREFVSPLCNKGLTNSQMTVEYGCASRDGVAFLFSWLPFCLHMMVPTPLGDASVSSAVTII